jgi:hypothetical protein
MKTYTTCITVICILWACVTSNALNAQGQQELQYVGKVYRTGIDMEVYVDNNDGNFTNDVPYKAFRTTAYRVLGSVAGRTYIQILKITKDDVRALNGGNFVANTVNSSNYASNYYVIDAQLDPVNKMRTGGLTTGTLLLPIKFRGQLYKNETKYPWELSTDIGVGEYFGYRAPIGRTQPIYANLITTLGLSTLQVGPDNSDPEGGSATLVGLTASAGVIFQVNDLQLGFVFGRDFAPGSVGAAWIYNEENWVAFSIGLKFLSNERW